MGAVGGLFFAGDEAAEGGFAGAVRADDGDFFFAFDFEVEVGEDFEVAVGFARVF